jgi:adenylate kinase
VTAPQSNVVIFGRPGSGKSSLAERLAVDYGFRLVRTGELLREAVRRGDDLGPKADDCFKTGDLVPDDLVDLLVRAALAAGGGSGLVLDGFPRTLGQVPLLARIESDLGFRITDYVEIAVRREIAEARMAGRRICSRCGATYHVVNQPPRRAGVCDRDGTPLERRPDDTPEIIARRQAVYDSLTDPILKYYRVHSPDRIRSINGEQPFDAVLAEMRLALDLAPPPNSPR